MQKYEPKNWQTPQLLPNLTITIRSSTCGWHITSMLCQAETKLIRTLNREDTFFSGCQARKPGSRRSEVRMDKMALASIGRKLAHTAATSHVPRSSSKLETLMSLDQTRALNGLSEDERGIQLSRQMRTDSPFPIHYIMPSLSSSKPWVMPLHTADEDVGNTVSNKFPLV